MEVSTAQILVVDDNVFITAGIKRLFTKDGLEVDIAANGMEAMEKVLNNKYKVVLTDLSMPKVTGQELISAIRQNADDDVKIIVITASNGEAMISEVLALGADDCIVKPFAVNDLLTRVKKML